LPNSSATSTQIVTGLLMAIVCTRHLPVIGLTLRDPIG
jgi:hypothetical protein